MTWQRYLDKKMTVGEAEAVTVTDPCYDAGLGVDLHLPKGTYGCYYETSDEGDWGVRIARAAIVLDKFAQAFERGAYNKHLAGSTGVDAGLCGFFIGKPDYTSAAWDAFCNRLRRIDEWSCKYTGKTYRDVYHTEEGFFTSSGYGDGEYSVFLLARSDKPIGAMVVFIGDEYEDDDE